VLYTVHFTAFCLGGGPFFPGHGVYAIARQSVRLSHGWISQNG